MSIFSSKGDGLGNVRQQRSEPWGYPDGGGRYDEDAADMPVDCEFDFTGTADEAIESTLLGVVNTEGYIAFRINDVKEGVVYSIEFITGSATYDSGNGVLEALPIYSVNPNWNDAIEIPTNEHAILIYKVNSIGPGGIQFTIHAQSECDSCNGYYTGTKPAAYNYNSSNQLMPDSTIILDGTTTAEQCQIAHEVYDFQDEVNPFKLTGLKTNNTEQIVTTGANNDHTVLDSGALITGETAVPNFDGSVNDPVLLILTGEEQQLEYGVMLTNNVDSTSGSGSGSSGSGSGSSGSGSGSSGSGSSGSGGGYFDDHEEIPEVQHMVHDITTTEDVGGLYMITTIPADSTINLGLTSQSEIPAQLVVYKVGSGPPVIIETDATHPWTNSGIYVNDTTDAEEIVIRAIGEDWTSLPPNEWQMQVSLYQEPPANIVPIDATGLIFDADTTHIEVISQADVKFDTTVQIQPGKILFVALTGDSSIPNLQLSISEIGTDYPTASFMRDLNNPPWQESAQYVVPDDATPRQVRINYNTCWENELPPATYSLWQSITSFPYFIHNDYDCNMCEITNSNTCTLQDAIDLDFSDAHPGMSIFDYDTTAGESLYIPAKSGCYAVLPCTRMSGNFYLQDDTNHTMDQQLYDMDDTLIRSNTNEYFGDPENPVLISPASDIDQTATYATFRLIFREIDCGSSQKHLRGKLTNQAPLEYRSLSFPADTTHVENITDSTVLLGFDTTVTVPDGTTLYVGFSPDPDNIIETDVSISIIRGFDNKLLFRSDIDSDQPQSEQIEIVPWGTTTFDDIIIRFEGTNETALTDGDYNLYQSISDLPSNIGSDGYSSIELSNGFTNSRLVSSSNPEKYRDSSLLVPANTTAFLAFASNYELNNMRIVVKDQWGTLIKTIDNNYNGSAQDCIGDFTNSNPIETYYIIEFERIDGKSLDHGTYAMRYDTTGVPLDSYILCKRCGWFFEQCSLESARGVEPATNIHLDFTSCYTPDPLQFTIRESCFLTIGISGDSTGLNDPITIGDTWESAEDVPWQIYDDNDVLFDSGLDLKNDQPDEIPNNDRVYKFILGHNGVDGNCIVFLELSACN